MAEQTAADTLRRCRSRSRYGKCSRSTKHRGPHAVYIAAGAWFGYKPGGIRLGYGRLTGDEFIPLRDREAVHA